MIFVPIVIAYTCILNILANHLFQYINWSHNVPMTSAHCAQHVRTRYTVYVIRYTLHAIRYTLYVTRYTLYV